MYKPVDINSLQFNAWFDGSVVRNKDGSPKMCYHFTKHEFNAFDTTKGELGQHFGTINQANQRALYSPENYHKGLNKTLYGRIIPVYLRIKKPLIMKDQESWNASHLVSDLLKRGIISQSDHDFIIATAEQSPETNYKQIRANDNLRYILKKKEYDGITYINTFEGEDKERSYIIFDPNQVKSAISNTGNFSSENDDITESLDNEQYPKYMNKKEIQKLIIRVHNGRIDKSLWTSLDSNFYHLVNIPMDNIKWQLYDNDYTDKNDPVTKKYSRLNTPFPPIVLNHNTSIIDGFHRAVAALLRGDSTISAYIPIHETQMDENDDIIESSDLFSFMTESKAFRNEHMVEKYTTQELGEILFSMMLSLHVIGGTSEVKKYTIRTLKFPKFDHIFLSSTDLANAITTLRNAREFLNQPSIDVPMNELKRYLRDMVLGKLTESFSRAFFFKLQTKLKIKDGSLLSLRREIVDSELNQGTRLVMAEKLYKRLSLNEKKCDILALLQILLDSLTI